MPTPKNVLYPLHGPTNEGAFRFDYRRGSFGVIHLVAALVLLGLVFLALGVSRLIALHPAMWAFLPILAVVAAHELLTAMAWRRSSPFDFKRHRRRKRLLKQISNSNGPPPVDILLPVCGEPTEILQRTWTAVTLLRYSNLTVTVLDDSNSPAIRVLAEEFGFKWLSRPNRGEHAKSGNLEYGFSRTKGMYYLVLDADFAPHPRIVEELLSVMLEDSQVGIVQSPQYFDFREAAVSATPFAHASAAAVEDFYRFVQPFRNANGAAMCVGTSALYRRAAIEESGFSLAPASEDVKQGLLVNAKGWKVVYLPLILSAGLTPQSYDAFVRQQSRWCHGSFLNLTSALFWRLRMSAVQRMLWLGNLLHYLRSGLGALLPFQLALLAWLPGVNLHWQNALWFLPLAVCHWGMWCFRFAPWRPSLIPVGRLRSIVHLQAILGFLKSRDYHWVATGDVRTRTGWWDAHGGTCLYLIFVGSVCLASALHLLPVLSWNSSLVFFWLVWEACLSAMAIWLMCRKDKPLSVATL